MLMPSKTSRQRLLKRLFIIFPFILLFVGVVLFVLYQILWKSEPLPPPPVVSTERPITVLRSAFVRTSSGAIDLLLHVENPNERVGAETFAFRVDYIDAGGATIGTYDGKSFILPGETKYVTVLGLRLDVADRIASVRTTIIETSWKELDEYTGIDLVTKGKQFHEASGSTGALVTGTVSNATNFDFREVKVNVVVFDSAKNVIGINATTVENVKANTERSFQATWFRDELEGDVAGLDVEAETDFYDRINLLPFSEEGSETPSLDRTDGIEIQDDDLDR